MMLSTGQVVFSATKRQLSPVPNIDCTSDRKSLNSLKRMRSWLKEEAIKECEAVKNYHAKRMVSSISLSNITTSDIDMLNMILFDEDFAKIPVVKELFEN